VVYDSTVNPDGPPDETTIMPRPPRDPLPPRYETLGELGRGGMGIVYKARDRETGEILAVKVLKGDIAANTQVLDRFKNELRLARQITHRNVARLYEFHRSDETVYLSMEFVEGESLRALLERAGKLPVDQSLDYARQLAAGLAEAHRQSIAHRDLKPENVMISPRGELKIMDFGISRSYATDVTATGSIIGTPAYMAPEQAEGRPVDHRTDIYALGLVLYEMFTGVAAFTGDTAMTLALKQVRERPKAPRSVDPTLPKHIEDAVLKCLEKDPAARFQSVHELVAALGGAPVRTTRRLPWRPAAVLAGIALIAWGGWRWWNKPSDSVRFPMESFTLSNGLQVVLSPDRSSPTVAVAVAYRAGTRYEQADRPGLAHLLEHVMYQGSANVGRGEHLALVSSTGGQTNGITLSDTAFFWNSLPSNQLELALFLEADRMRGLEITPAGLAAARSAVIEERAQSLAQPYARAHLPLTEIAFDTPANQRTRFPQIEAWNAATVDDLKRFYDAHYTPANAGLVVLGDFDEAKARELIRKYFEPVPKRDPPPVPDSREPGRSAEKRETTTDPTMPSPFLTIAWRAPSATDPDWFVIKRLAEVLGANEAARLHVALVKNAGIASTAVMNLTDSAGPNLLAAVAILAPGKDPAQAERMVYEEIDRIAREGVPQAELDVYATDAIRRRAFQLVSKASRAVLIAQFLTAYNQLEFVNRWEDAESRVSRQSVQEMAKKYFAPSNRTVLVVKP
jgi:predicted Zn-dependent peptidase